MTDAVTPPTLIVDQNRGYREWLLPEIYTGPNSTGRYVPNKDDAVRDWAQGVFRVVDVDYTTGLSTMQLWTPPQNPNTLTDEDILLGTGPGTQSESFRLYIDPSVTPHTLAIDARIHIHGTQATYVKYFRGTDISSTTGQVISAYYDQSGNFLGENIPLENVVMDANNVVAVKTPKVGYTTQDLQDGDVVTAVVYNDAGGAVSIAKLLVANTSFIRSTDASAKYVKAISLETPFLSTSDPKLIQYPINMPVSALNLIGVVTYSDGSKLRMPVDGTKFSLFGLENYIATIQGQQLDLVLSYKLSANEYNYIGTPSPNQHISESYKATTLQADGAYSIKLFVTPVWIDALNGYRLEYYLYNLDREFVYPVTNLVDQQTGSRAFDPVEYGTVQHLAVAINMNQVDSQFANYRHVQSFDLTLLRAGNSQDGDNWTVAYTPGQNPPYGVGVKALATYVEVGNWKLDVSCGAATQADWLNEVFYATQPLFDPGTETQAPTPNYFALVYGSERIELPIAQWNAITTMTSTFVEGTPIYLEFIRRNSQTDLQLGISGLIVHFPAAQ